MTLTVSVFRIFANSRNKRQIPNYEPNFNAKIVFTSEHKKSLNLTFVMVFSKTRASVDIRSKSQRLL
jgi:hypothetical protein